MHEELRYSIYEPFYAVFTIGLDEMFAPEDFEEGAVFSSREAAQDFADKRISEDGTNRLVVRCNGVAVVEIPAPVVRELSAEKGLPSGVKPPPKTKSVIK